MKDVQEWLGHGDIGTMMNIYAHIEASRKTSMLDGIESAVKNSFENSRALMTKDDKKMLIKSRGINPEKSMESVSFI